MILTTKIDSKEVMSFIQNTKLITIDDINILTEEHKKLISSTLTDISGVEFGFIPCAYSIEGEPVNIVRDGDDLSSIFDLRSGDFILQLDKQDNICYTIKFLDLLNLVSKFKYLDEDNSSLFKSRFTRRLNPIDIEGDTVIAFIPSILKDDVKLYTYLEGNRITKIIDTSSLDSDEQFEETIKGYMSLF